MASEVLWSPFKILHIESNSHGISNYVLMILNTKINLKPKYLLPLWNEATIKYTVDGGTNRWFKWLATYVENSGTVPSPNFVSGDMDSINSKLLTTVENNCDINVVLTEDQNETDFSKALRQINCLNTQNYKIENVIAVVDTCGRFDQIMANINSLFKAKTICPNVNIFQLANDSLSWLLYKGRHKIIIPEILRKNNNWCALIPIGEECDNVTTTGLKWNLNKGALKFGGIISTSNTYDINKSFITIETTKPLLWSMGLNKMISLSSDD